MSAATVTIPDAFQKSSDLVAIPRRDYQEFLQMRAEMEDALKKIERGNKEYKQGKTRTVQSLDELM